MDLDEAVDKALLHEELFGDKMGGESVDSEPFVDDLSDGLDLDETLTMSPTWR